MTTRTQTLSTAALLCALCALLPRLAAAECREANSPATPVPQSLWLDELRPAPTPRQGNQLPDTRDSTDYITTTIPGSATGHELFSAVATYGEHLFVTYNAGLQVWRSGPGRLDNPARIAVRDGWLGHWLEFPRPGEADTFVNDVAVAPLTDDVYVVAVAADSQVGVSLWRFEVSTGNLTQVYQGDLGTFLSVSATRHNDRVIVLAASRTGVFAFDGGVAVQAQQPCVEHTNEPSCPGVRLGQVGGLRGSNTTSVRSIERGGSRHLMAAGNDAILSNSSTGVSLVEITNPDAPQNAVLRSQQFIPRGHGVEVFEKDGHAYLATMEHLFINNAVHVKPTIFSVEACLGSSCTPRNVWTAESFANSAPRKRLRYSFDNLGTPNNPADDVPFIYVGADITLFEGASKERLYNLGALQPTGPNDGIYALTEGGPTYLDACSNAQVGYWGWYYPLNDNGLRNVSPRSGVFVQNRFYRAARGVFDVHIWRRPTNTNPDPDTGIPDTGRPDTGTMDPMDTGNTDPADTGRPDTGTTDPMDTSNTDPMDTTTNPDTSNPDDVSTPNDTNTQPDTPDDDTMSPDNASPDGGQDQPQDDEGSQGGSSGGGCAVASTHTHRSSPIVPLLLFVLSSLPALVIARRRR